MRSRERVKGERRKAREYRGGETEREEEIIVILELTVSLFINVVVRRGGEEEREGEEGRDGRGGGEGGGRVGGKGREAKGGRRGREKRNGKVMERGGRRSNKVHTV